LGALSQDKIKGSEKIALVFGARMSIVHEKRIIFGKYLIGVFIFGS